jgi:alpha-beta hydrolase superfamily lysophospholipase
MRTEELKWKTRDGLNIHGHVWESTERKAKAVVCLVHGLGEHIARYHHVAEVLGRDGYALFGADLRGHGRSEGIRGHTPSIDAYMEDINLLIEQARKKFPDLPIFLYGHSLGGILVLNYGLTQSPILKGVISTGPALRTALENQPVKIAAAKILGALLPSTTIASGLDASTLSRDEKVVTAYKNDPLVHDKVSLGFGRTMLGVNRWVLENSSKFKYPLLLMHGKADQLSFPKGSEEFASNLKGTCTLMLWDNLYHEIHNEPEQNEVLKTMTIWMDARL